MNITSTTIKAYNLILTESEMRAAIDQPASLVGILRTALHGGFDDGDQPTFVEAKHHSAIKQRKARNYPKDSGSISPHSGRAKQSCSVCHRMIAKKFMTIHMQKKHPGEKAPTT